MDQQGRPSHKPSTTPRHAAISRKRIHVHTYKESTNPRLRHLPGRSSYPSNGPGALPGRLVRITPNQSCLTCSICDATSVISCRNSDTCCRKRPRIKVQLIIDTHEHFNRCYRKTNLLIHIKLGRHGLHLRHLLFQITLVNRQLLRNLRAWLASENILQLHIQPFLFLNKEVLCEGHKSNM